MKYLKYFLIFLILTSFSSRYVLAQDIPNASFETWSNGEPVTWHTTNQSILGTQFSVVNKETSSPQSGLASARLEVVTKNILLVGSVTVPGVLTLSQIAVDILNQTVSISGGYPFTAMPQQLAGFLKYQPVGTDTAYFGFALTKRHEGILDTVGYAADTVTGAISTWTHFQLPLTYNIWEAPDTMSILFLCSNPNDPVVHTGTKMWVDNLSFIYGNVGIEGITFGEEYRIYADAATKQIIIQTWFGKPRNLDLSLISMGGQEMLHKRLWMDNSFERLETANMMPGTYILRISEGRRTLDSRKITILN
jgi:hypothetical protein